MKNGTIYKKIIASYVACKLKRFSVEWVYEVFAQNVKYLLPNTPCKSFVISRNYVQINALLRNCFERILKRSFSYTRLCQALWFDTTATLDCENINGKIVDTNIEFIRGFKGEQWECTKLTSEDLEYLQNEPQKTLAQNMRMRRKGKS